MADLNIALEIAGNASGGLSAVNSVERALGTLNTTSGGFLGTIQNVIGGFGTFGLAARGVESAVSLVTSSFGGWIADAQNAQSVQTQLNSVLESTHGAAGVSAEAVNALSDQLSGLTPFEDEAITSAQNMLLTFTNIGKNVFPQATETVLNMAQAMGGDLQGSAIQLGKALNDPTQGMSALTRVGVTFSDAQKDTIKAMQDSGDMAGAQGVILKELETEFGGAARAAGTTFSGQLSILETKLGNVKEAIFTPVLAALIPVFNQVGDAIASPAFQTLLPKIGEFLSTVVSTGANIAVEAFNALTTTFNAVSTTFGTVIDQLSSGDISGAVNTIWNAIKQVGSGIITTLDELGQSLFGAGTTMMSTLAGGLVAGAQAIWDTISSIAEGIASFFVGNSPPPVGPLSTIDEAGTTLMQTYTGGMVNGLDGLNTVVHAVSDSFSVMDKSAKFEDTSKTFESMKDNLSGMKDLGKDVAENLKEMDGAVRDIDRSMGEFKFSIDSVKFAMQEQLAPLQDQLALLKGGRNFKNDEKKLDLERRDLALRLEEIGVRGNKDALKTIKSKQDELRAEKDVFDINTRQAQLERDRQALPIEEKIQGIKDQYQATLTPLQKQLDILTEQKRQVDFQRQAWQSLKKEIEDATPKGGGGGGGGKGGGAGGAKAPATTGTSISDSIKKAIPTADEIKDKMIDLGKGAASHFGTGLQTWLSSNVGGLIGGGLGAVIGAVFGPLGAIAGATFGANLGQSINAKLKALGEGVDFSSIIDRIKTLVVSLSQFNSLAASVNAAFGDLIPPGLNPILDAVDGAFGRLKAGFTTLVSDIKSGGLPAVWQDITSAMSDFAPTGERLSALFVAMVAAIKLMIPSPVVDLISGFIDMATSATQGQSALGTLATVVNTVSGAMEAAVNFVKDHTAAQFLLVAAAGALATALTLMAVAQTAATAATTITTTATVAYTAVQWALNVALEANPIGIVVVALGALAAALIFAYKNSETFRNIVDTAFSNLKGNIINAISAINTAIQTFNDIIGVVSGVITDFSGTSTNVWNTIKENTEGSVKAAQASVALAFEGIRASVEEKVGLALELVNTWGGNVTKFLGQLKNDVLAQAKEIGQSIIDGIKAGIQAGWDILVSFVTDLARSLLGAAKAAVKSGSPSVEFMHVGEDIVQGLVVGMRQTQSLAIATISDLGLGLVSSSQSMLLDPMINIGKAIAVNIAQGFRDNTTGIIGLISDVQKGAEGELGDLDRWLQGWIGEVAAHRTELLRRFNYAAYLRGEGIKMVPELEAVVGTYEANIRRAFTATAEALTQIATNLQANILKARTETEQQVLAAVSAAAKQIQNLMDQRSLNAMIQGQKDAFTQMQALQKSYFDTTQAVLTTSLKRQEDIARIHTNTMVALSRIEFNDTNAQSGPVAEAQRALDTQTQYAKIGYERTRDLSRAATDDEKAQINAKADTALAAIQDQLDEDKAVAEATKNYRLELQRQTILEQQRQQMQALLDQQALDASVAEQTAEMRNAINNRQIEYTNMVNEQQRQFEQKQADDALNRQIDNINRDRDARIQALNEALATKEQQLADDAAQERAKTIADLQTKLADYKTEFIDKIQQAFRNAGVDLADFISDINGKMTDEINVIGNSIGVLIGKIADARQQVGATPVFAAMPEGTVNTPNVISGGGFAGIGSPTGGGLAGMGQAKVTNYNLQVTNTGTPLTQEDVLRLFNRMQLLTG